MKKRVSLVSLTIVLLIGLVFGFVKKENLEKLEKNLDNNLIAIYVGDSNGNYTLSNSNSFPSNGYKLNAEKSLCTNGGTISQIEDTKLVNINLSKMDNCTLYFDLALISFTIDGTQYFAEEEMTWGQWVDSSYNTGDWVIAGLNGRNDYGLSTNSRVQACGGLADRYITGTDSQLIENVYNMNIIKDNSYTISVIKAPCP